MVSKIKYDYLANFITRQMQLLDQHILDLSTLLEEVTTPLEDVDLDRETLTLCQMVWAFTNSEYPKESAFYKAESLLDKNGIEWVDFSPEKRSFFEIMPTKKSSRVVYPALQKKSGGALVCKGQYLESQK